MRWVLANPEFHHWHRCNEPSAYDRNFSPHFVVCDLLFCTAYIPPKASLPARYGIPEKAPPGFLGQMAFPFQRMTPSEMQRAVLQAREGDTQTVRSDRVA